MSLPGLELSEPSAESQYVPAPPTQINLSRGSEWRFEVAFGTTVKIKVCFSFHSSGFILLVCLSFLAMPLTCARRYTCGIEARSTWMSLTCRIRRGIHWMELEKAVSITRMEWFMADLSRAL